MPERVMRSGAGPAAFGSVAPGMIPTVLLLPGQVAPVERLALDVLLSQVPRDVGLHQLAAQVEGVRRVPLHPEPGEDVADAGAAHEALAVVDVDRLAVGVDAEVAIRHLPLHGAQLLLAGMLRARVAGGQKPRVVAFRERLPQ